MADKPAPADVKLTESIKPKNPVEIPAKVFTELRLSEFTLIINSEGSFIIIKADPFNPETKESAEQLRTTLSESEVLARSQEIPLLAELIKCIYVYAEQKLKENGDA